MPGSRFISLANEMMLSLSYAREKKNALYFSGGNEHVLRISVGSFLRFSLVLLEIRSPVIVLYVRDFMEECEEESVDGSVSVGDEKNHLPPELLHGSVEL